MKLTKQLVQTLSVVNTTGEKKIALQIKELLARLSYFQENPSHLVLQRTEADEQERYNVLALVKGRKKQSKKTVILLGHLDTVGIDDFHHLRELACHPDSLMTELKKEASPPLIQEHLNSDAWLFGRGVLDMKAGLASHLYLIQYFSEHPEELEGNLVLIAECDEEDGSHGILTALKGLRQWKKEHHLDYVAAINADFVSPRSENDPKRYIYKGTVGKLLPSFYITGAETHVGSCFEGIDPNFLAAELTKQISYNPELCNEAYGETTVPPVALKQTDLKPTYTVQTALAAYVYYNFFIHSWSPKDVLEKLSHQAELAFSHALEAYKSRYQSYCQLSGETYREIPWKPNVMTYEEMERSLIAEHGEKYLVHMTHFKNELLNDTSLDTRMFAARVVEEAFQWMPDKRPTMILFYSSLYSPRIEVVGQTEQEQKLIDSLDEAVAALQPEYPHPIVIRNYFPYISDMSFVSLSDDEEGIHAVIANNPGWGTKHYVEYQDVRELNVPVINIGPYGHDAHKKYERAEIKYSFEMVPNLTYQVIKNLLQKYS